MLEEILARKLIEIRNKNAWTQETAAELCDLSVRYWGKIERAQVTVSLATLTKIAGGLNMRATDLLNDSQEIKDSNNG